MNLKQPICLVNAGVRDPIKGLERDHSISRESLVHLQRGPTLLNTDGGLREIYRRCREPGGEESKQKEPCCKRHHEARQPTLNLGKP